MRLEEEEDIQCSLLFLGNRIMRTAWSGNMYLPYRLSFLTGLYWKVVLSELKQYNHQFLRRIKKVTNTVSLY